MYDIKAHIIVITTMFCCRTETPCKLSSPLTMNSDSKMCQSAMRQMRDSFCALEWKRDFWGLNNSSTKHWMLVSLHVSSTKIVVFSVPVDMKFQVPNSKQSLKATLCPMAQKNLAYWMIHWTCHVTRNWMLWLISVCCNKNPSKIRTRDFRFAEKVWQLNSSTT